jgi:WS/DGAT/MGAT family acyltransferase
MHHSTIDGVSGANLMGYLFDLEPDPLEPDPLDAIHRPGSVVPDRDKGGDNRTWSPGPRPGEFELLRRSFLRALSKPLELAMLVPSTAVRIGSAAWYLARDSGGTAAPAPFTAPRTSFNATITGRRSIAFTEVPLSVVKEVKNAFGVTVNDVLTAVVGGALRRYLLYRGELPPRPLIAAEPVSVHDRTPSVTGTTQVSIMFSTLATDLDDRAEALKAISAANGQAKKVNQMMGAETLVQWADHLPRLVLSLGFRAYSSLHAADHHPVIHNLILSNVPGPPVPLYLAGARLVGLYPLGPIMDGAGLNVTVMSQEDRIGVGMITCPDLMPDVWELAGEVPAALDELVRAVRRQHRRRPRRTAHEASNATPSGAKETATVSSTKRLTAPDQ